MNTLLKLRRLNRKRANLSHKRFWFVIEALLISAISLIALFFINAIRFGLV